MNKQAINRRLRSNPALSIISETDRQELADRVEVVDYPAGMVILQQDQARSFLYILDEGRVRLTRTDQNGREVLRREITPGAMFGRYAILNNSVQRTTAVAITGVRLLQIRSTDLNRILAKYPALRNTIVPTEIAGRLRTMPLFRSLDDDTVRNLADLVHPQHLAPGDAAPPIASAPAFYLIDTGQIRVGRPGATFPTSDDPVFSAGNFFGDEIFTSTSLSSPAQAVSDSRVLGFAHDDFAWLLTTFPTVASDLIHPDIAGRMHKVLLFSKLNDEQLRFLAAYFSWEFFPSGRDVTIQGMPGDDFKILDDGEAVIRSMDDKGQERPRNYMHHGEFFGETTLFLGDRRDASVQSISGSVWLSLNRADFKAAMEARSDIRQALTLKPETERRLRAPHYDWMDPDETIVLHLRRHVFILWVKMLPAVVLAVALIGFLGFGLMSNTLQLVLAIPIAALLVLDAAWMIWVYVDWSNDWFIVTNKRVMQIERVVLTSEYRFEAPLDKVQNVQVSRGALGTTFNFGILLVQTAALPTVPTAGRLQFTYTPDPDVNEEKLMNEVTRARARSRAQNREAIRQGLQRSLHTGLEVLTPDTVVAVEKPAPPPRPKESFMQRRFPFVSQEPDRIVWRKHWVNLLERSLEAIILTLLFGYLLLASLLNWFPLNNLNQPWLPWLFGALTFLSATGIWYQYSEWYNDVYVVTRDRIIDLEQSPLLGREERREANLANVQNVTLTVPGFWANILDYGTVVVQTAGQRGSFDFKFVGNPRQVQSEIFKRIQEYQANQDARQSAQRQAELQQWFEIYDNVADQE